jgi:hypothetical protein
MEKKIFNEEIEDAKNPTKILSYTFPLSIASCAHTAQGNLILYYDKYDGEDFMQKWFTAVLKQAQIVEKDNRYTDVEMLVMTPIYLMILLYSDIIVLILI